MPARIFYGWRVVAACFTIAMFGWGLGLFGSSVYLQAVTAFHGWSVAEVSTAISIFFLVSAAIQRLVGRSISLHGPRPALAVGAICMVSSVSLIGQVHSIWQLYADFVLLGIGWATLSTTGISATVAPWFERHQGRSMALAIMGASFGAIVMVPLLLFAIGSLGMQKGLLAIGIGSGAILIPIILIVLRHRGPADLGLSRDGDDHVPGQTSAAPAHIANELNGRRLIVTSTAAFALVLLVQIGFITHHVALAQPYLGTSGAGMLVSLTGLSALLGRFYLVKVVDSKPVRRLASQAMAVQFVSLFAIGMFPNAYVVVGASLIYGFAIGNVTTLSPIVVRREFGAIAFASVYGTAATAIQFITAFGPALIGFLRETLGGYGPTYLIASGVTAIGCATLYLGGHRERSPVTPKQGPSRSGR